MYCRDCKHWRGSFPDWGTCSKAESVYDVKIHARGFPTKAVAVPFDPTAGRFPAAGIGGSLETSHDFGCVQFEARAGADESHEKRG